MENYKLTITDGIISSWGEEGQGEQLGTKDLGLEQEIEMLNTESIVTAINDLMGLKLQSEDLSFNNGAYGMFATIENSDGLPDENGAYLVDYTFTVEKVNPLVDLETVFSNI